MDRTQIIEGPAIVIFKGVTFYTQDAIKWTPGISTFDLKTTAHGIISTRYDDIFGKLTFTPAGVWTDYLQLWKPFETPIIGSSMLGASDSSAVIHSISGQKFTIYGCGFTKIPNAMFSAVKPIAGSLEISAVGANDTEWSDESKRFVQEAAAFSDAGFDPDAILTQPYTASYGNATPFDDFETESGIEVTFDLQIKPRKTDKSGTIDLRMSGLTVTASFTPVGISEAQYNALFKLQGSGVSRGASVAGGSNTLVISGPGVHFQLYGAVPKDPSLVFDAEANRCGPVKLQAVRQFSSGAMQPLYYIGTAAP